MKLTDVKCVVICVTHTMAVVAAVTLLLPTDKILAHEESHHGTHSSPNASSSDVEIVIQEGGHLVLKGPHTHGQVLTLVAGESIVLALRNEDIGPREFISPLFTRTETHFGGRATGIFRKDAAGFRLNPGDTLTLEFTAPYSGFRRMYDLIWCGHHDGRAGTEMKDLLIVMTEEEVPAHGRR